MIRRAQLRSQSGTVNLLRASLASWSCLASILQPRSANLHRLLWLTTAGWIADFSSRPWRANYYFSVVLRLLSKYLEVVAKGQNALQEAVRQCERRDLSNKINYHKEFVTNLALRMKRLNRNCSDRSIVSCIRGLNTMRY